MVLFYCTEALLLYDLSDNGRPTPYGVWMKIVWILLLAYDQYECSDSCVVLKLDYRCFATGTPLLVRYNKDSYHINQ